VAAPGWRVLGAAQQWCGALVAGLVTGMASDAAIEDEIGALIDELIAALSEAQAACYGATTVADVDEGEWSE